MFNVRSAGGGQVLARLWRVGRSFFYIFDVHLLKQLFIYSLPIIDVEMS